jgi:prevent-host-death family protein
MATWQLQTAKARLSELLRSSELEGPQEITLHGRAAAVVLSKADYDRLTSRKSTFLDLVRRSPLVGARLQTARRRSGPRRVRL